MKELDQTVLQKGFFASTKGHLHNPEGQVEVESPQIGSFFLVNFIYINKIFFFQKWHFYRSIRSLDTLSF